MLTDWLEGGLLVLLGFLLTTGVQFWRDARKEREQRGRILDYLRLEVERNRKVADGLVALFERGVPSKGYYTIAGVTNEAWRVAASEWAITRLNAETMAILTDAAQCAALLNTAVSEYTTYGVTQGAMGSYQAVLSEMSKQVVNGAKMYLAAIDRLRLRAA